jgi:hypothetical protein
MSESNAQPNGAQTGEAPDVYTHIAMVAETMAQVAWQKMGLQHDPFTGKMEKNVAEAKVAIDLVAHCVTVLEPQLDAEDRRRMHNLLRDLRINYVQQNTESGI